MTATLFRRFVTSTSLERKACTSAPRAAVIAPQLLPRGHPLVLRAHDRRGLQRSVDDSPEIFFLSSSTSLMSSLRLS